MKKFGHITFVCLALLSANYLKAPVVPKRNWVKKLTFKEIIVGSRSFGEARAGMNEQGIVEWKHFEDTELKDKKYLQLKIADPSDQSPLEKDFRAYLIYE